MSGMSKYPMKDGDNVVGKNIGDSQPTVMIKGSGIAAQHCVIHF
jgi:hypothetical protein